MADTLAKYKPRRPPAPADDRFAALFAQAEEFLRQSEALRQDFPLREAKLRQAADLFDDASAQAAGLFGALDERRRSADHAAARASHAAAAAETLLSDLADGRVAVLRAAQASLSVQADTEAMRQDHYRLTEEIATARLDMQALIDEARATRAEVTALQAQSRPFAAGAALEALPGAAPGASPGSFASVPTLYPAGPTVLGFLYPLITGTIQATGGTMTGDLTVDLSASSGPIVSLTSSFLPISGLFGVILDKAKTLGTTAHGIGWKVGGAETWSLGQDFDTNNSDNGGTGDSDFIVCNDRTANAGAGADIMRFSHAAKDTIGSPGSCKMEYGGIAAGSPRTKTSLWNVTAGAGLGGINLNINSANAREHIALINAHGTSKRATINYNDLWLIGPDIAGIGTDHGLTYRDKEHSLNRLYIESSTAISAKMGLNTTGPVGGFHSATSQDPTLYDTVQTGLAVGFSTIANRTWLVQQILDASQTENFLFMMGSLGAGSTRATPVATSTSTPALGIKANQTQMDLIAAPSGTNQTIVRGVSVSQIGGAAAVGLFGATPVIRQPGTQDLRATLISYGALPNDASALPINTNGGALTVGAVAASGALSGSGTALQLARIAYTFPSDANQTLSASDKANVVIDIQTGVISAQRDLLVSGNAGATYFIINREAFAVNVRVGANPGIVVGSHKSRIIVFPGGTTAFSMGPDQDYTA